MLKTSYLDQMIKNCGIKFTYRQLIINNVKHPEIVRKYAQKKVDAGILDVFYFVDDYRAEIAEKLEIQPDFPGQGQHYLFGALTGIYLAKTEFVLHLMLDVFLPNPKHGLWIPEACELLTQNPDYLIANPVRNYNRQEWRSNKIIGNFYVGRFYITDNCFLLKSKDFQQKIYNHPLHTTSKGYPTYGQGASFEQRANNFMYAKNLKQLIAKDCSFLHCDFLNKANKLRRLWFYILMKLGLYIPYLNWRNHREARLFTKKTLDYS
ncbi:hypothetical protein NO2_0178 [Candidatus Termititenax persephonae]|uniref:Glycosyl transferase GTA-type super family n=1 Tax=Candidatus Termititenax persephonae TaxID=2218525 RepID=A0A388TEN5_9BACT|nr:hypothetical protein NO2_0178 [Candidatus Termititenax persephonae]